MKKQHIFNAEYSLAQGLYWLCYCACTTFSVQFMQERGYSNSSIGHMISLGNIIGVLSAFAIASWVDRIRDHGLFFAIETLLVVQLATQLFFLKIPETIYSCQ
jgi:cyanate permease